MRESQVLVPAASVKDFTGMRLVPPRQVAQTETVLTGAGPVVITEAEGGVVGAMTRSVTAIERGYGPIDRGMRHPALGDQPVSTHAPLTLPWGGGTGIFSWLETDDVLVALASRDLSQDELATLAARTDLDGAGLAVVPGRRIGVIPAPWIHPTPSVQAWYDPSDSSDGERTGGVVAIHTASPTTQAAFQAMIVPDPGTVFDPTTDASCCDDNIFRPQRRLTIAGRDAILATLTPDHRVLIVEGDPGAVLLASGGQGRGSLPDDNLLLAVGQSLRPADLDELGDDPQRTGE